MLRVTSVAQAVIAETKKAVQTLRDSTLDDEQKETGIQKAAVDLFRTLFLIVLLAAVCIVAAMVPVVLASWTGLTAREAVIPLFYSWELITITIIAFIVLSAWG